jgi:hypothetical protein
MNNRAEQIMNISQRQLELSFTQLFTMQDSARQDETSPNTKQS